MATLLESESTYRSAHQSALIVSHPDPGIIRTEGEDRIDFIDRMSTNDIHALPQYGVLATVLINALARVIDYEWVINLPSNLLLVTSPGRAQVVHEWLSKHIFFQDDVRLTPDAQDWTLWGVYGPKAAELLTRQFDVLEDISTEGVVELEGGYAWSINQPSPGGYLLLLNGDASTRLSWDPADQTQAREAFKILRVEAGLPEFGREITEERIPLEVGLSNAISFSKGCYIGQEIIARMESRGKQAWTLAGVELEERVDEGSELHMEGKNAGILSSVVFSPERGWIGLGLVKPSALQNDRRATAGDAKVPATVTDLPFA